MDRFASVAGFGPARGPSSRHAVSPAMVAGVLAAVVGLMALYVGVRQLTQPTSDELDARSLQRIAPTSGADRLLSIEDIKKLADQE
jgi:hypothetical protein